MVWRLVLRLVWVFGLGLHDYRNPPFQLVSQHYEASSSSCVPCPVRTFVDGRVRPTIFCVLLEVD